MRFGADVEGVLVLNRWEKSGLDIWLRRCHIWLSKSVSGNLTKSPETWHQTRCAIFCLTSTLHKAFGLLV